MPLLTCLFLLSSCTVVVREHVNSHPFYLSALSDLRLARAFLDKLTPNEELDAVEIGAIAEINAAIKEIKEAAIDDGRNLSDHPAIDVKLGRTDRFTKALELLDKVHKDINHGEDNAFANDLKKRALKHVNRARNIIKGVAE